MLDTKGIQVSVRAATAAGVACGLAQLLHLEHPIYAFIAAVIGTVAANPAAAPAAM